MTEVENKKLADKIRALIAKAEGTDNEHEAEAFMAKALELLDKHRMSIGALKDESDPMGMTNISLKYSDGWRVGIAYSAALYMGCKAVRSREWVMNSNGKLTQETVMRLVGRLGARTTAECMIPYLIASVSRAGSKLAGAGASKAQKVENMARVGTALHERLNKLYEKGLKAEQNAAVKPVFGGNWLVPMSEAEAALTTYFPKLITTKYKLKNPNAAARAAANGISLNGQLNKRPQAGQKLIGG